MRRWKLERTISGHSGAIYDIVTSGNFIFTASADRYVAKWNWRSGEQELLAIKLDSTPYSICLSQNDRILNIGLSSGDIHVIDLATKREVRWFQQHQTAVFCLVENPLKNHIYSADASGNIGVWNAANHELLLFLPFDCGKIRNIEVSADGRYLHVASQDGKIRILETEYFNLLDEFMAHDGGVGFTLSSGNSTYSGGKDAHLKKWSLGQLNLSIPAHNFMIYQGIAIDNQLITASRDKTIKVWELPDLLPVQRLDVKEKGHKHSVNKLISLDAAHFASCSDDGSVKIWTTP